MAVTPFTRSLGEEQGRLEPDGWIAPDGTHVFVLGHDAPGRVEPLKIGDYTEVSQDVIIGGAMKLLRVRIFARGAAQLPAGVAWEVSLRVAGVARVTRRIDSARSRNFQDLAANVTDVVGVRPVAVRLTLVAA